MIDSWQTLMTKLRINPVCVARTLLHNLKDYAPLTLLEERQIMLAIESTGISADRLLADLSRNTINKLLENL
jgi:hypothetical protein